MKWFLTAILAGLFAAGPFLTSRALGTKEAYNYSLAVADAVTQFRAGHVPMLVGQTEFAFNGRIHPLRTAPGLAYAASLLDLLTFRQLGFRTLQNLVLALALIGGAAACHWSLRRATPATPPVAAALSAAYVLCPAVLAAAYGMDLYMTVLTVPFVPLVIAASLSCFHDRQRTDLPWLAVALAACWLAHPPIALWLSFTAILLQAAALVLCRPARSAWRPCLLAAVLFLVLAGFGFVSALTVSPYGDIVHQRDTSLLLAEVQRIFHDTLRPVSARGDQLGDFQAGYLVWGLAVAVAALAVRRRSPPAIVLLSIAGFLLLFTVPVPVVHAWLWQRVPTLVINLTNQWPMQRLYLPITTLVLFAFGLTWRAPENPGRAGQDLLRLALAVAIGWTLWESWPFIGRGYRTRQTPEATNDSLLSSNIELTPISYALLGAPGDFQNGVMDPAFAFRLLAPFDAHPLATNWTAALPATDATRTLHLVAAAGETDAVLDLPGSLRLAPGRRYRLTFDFLAPPFNAILQIRGATLRREYSLPSAGGPRGFGQQAGNNRALTLWTDQRTPEEVTFRLVGPGLAGSDMRGRAFATVTVEPVASDRLPVELLSLLPLRCRVEAAEAGYLETPRSFIRGYAATVDGRPVRVQRSPEGLVMLPVPKGGSRVELRYVGSSLLRGSFWAACLGWLGVAAWGWLRRGAVPGRQAAPGWLQAMARARAWSALTWSRRIGLAGFAVVLAAAILGWNRWTGYRAAVGPVRIRFVLPRGETNRQQPLLVTGQPHAGTFVYAVYTDPDHIKLGVDVWGVLGCQTGPIRTDYFAAHEIVVDSGALYPAGHPALRNLPPAARARLHNHLRVEFDGQTVLEREVNTYDSRASEVTVGRNLIGGSSCEPRFAGEILGVERLPLPTPPH